MIRVADLENLTFGLEWHALAVQSRFEVMNMKDAEFSLQERVGQTITRFSHAAAGRPDSFHFLTCIDTNG